MQERDEGDPYYVASAVSAMGAMLKRCWPELFEGVP